MIVVMEPGASPEVVEADVTKPLEYAINTVSGVSLIRSNSLEGQSQVFAEFRMAGTGAVKLAEFFEVVERDRQSVQQLAMVIGLPHTGEMQHRIEQHRRMAAREYEPVARGPQRLARIVAQVVLPELIGDGRERHRRARMAAVGLLHTIHAQGAYRIDRQKVNRSRGFGNGHSARSSRE